MPGAARRQAGRLDVAAADADRAEFSVTGWRVALRSGGGRRRHRRAGARCSPSGQASSCSSRAPAISPCGGRRVADHAHRGDPRTRTGAGTDRHATWRPPWGTHRRRDPVRPGHRPGGRRGLLVAALPRGLAASRSQARRMIVGHARRGHRAVCPRRTARRRPTRARRRARRQRRAAGHTARAPCPRRGRGRPISSGSVRCNPSSTTSGRRSARQRHRRAVDRARRPAAGGRARSRPTSSPSRSNECSPPRPAPRPHPSHRRRAPSRRLTGVRGRPAGRRRRRGDRHPPFPFRRGRAGRIRRRDDLRTSSSRSSTALQRDRQRRDVVRKDDAAQRRARARRPGRAADRRGGQRRARPARHEHGTSRSASGDTRPTHGSNSTHSCAQHCVSGPTD